MKLTRRPDPFPDESPLGYIVRLAERNRCGNTSWLAARLGVDVFNPVNCIGLVAKVAESCGDELRPMPAASKSEREGKTFVVGTLVDHDEVYRRRPRVCGGCLSDAPYRRAVWEIAAMTACPQHGTKLLDACPACRAAFSWNTAAVSRCRCGHQLGGLGGEPAEVGELLVAGAIHRALGLPDGGATPFAPEIEALPLRDLVETFVFLARADRDCEAMKARPGKALDRQADLRRGAVLAAAWPASFHDILERSRAAAPLRVHEEYQDPRSRELGWVYRAIRRLRTEPRGRLLHDEAIRFAGAGRFAWRVASSRDGATFLTAVQAADLLKVEVKHVKPLLAKFDAGIPTVGSGVQIGYARDRVERLAALLGRLLNRKALAVKLGVDWARAAELVFGGLLPNHGRVPGRRCRGVAVDSKDVDRFLDGITASISARAGCGREFTFRSLVLAGFNRGLSFVDVVGTFASRELWPSSIDRTRVGLAALRFDLVESRRALDAVVTRRNKGENADAAALTVAEAARQLRKSPGVVESLVRVGLLEAEAGRIETAALERFVQEYVDGASLALEWGIKGQEVVRVLGVAGVKPAATVLGKGMGRVIWRRADAQRVASSQRHGIKPNSAATSHGEEAF